MYWIWYLLNWPLLLLVSFCCCSAELFVRFLVLVTLNCHFKSLLENPNSGSGKHLRYIYLSGSTATVIWKVGALGEGEVVYFFYFGSFIATIFTKKNSRDLQKKERKENYFFFCCFPTHSLFIERLSLIFKNLWINHKMFTSDLLTSF